MHRSFKKSFCLSASFEYGACLSHTSSSALASGSFRQGRVATYVSTWMRLRLVDVLLMRYLKRPISRMEISLLDTGMQLMIQLRTVRRSSCLASSPLCDSLWPSSDAVLLALCLPPDPQYFPGAVTSHE